MLEMNHWHILGDDGEPDWAHPVDIITFTHWLSAHTAATDIGRAEARTSSGATVLVSTRYFGWCATTDIVSGHPHVWETMIFGGVYGGYQRRYVSRQTAREGHYAALKLVQRLSVPCEFCFGSGQMWALRPAVIQPMDYYPASATVATLDIQDILAHEPARYHTICAVCNGNGWLAADAPEQTEQEASE